MTNERAYTPSLVLHVLRNPHGWSAEAITAARLQAADEIERLKKREKDLMDVIDSRDRALGFVPLDEVHASEPEAVAPFPYPTDRDGWICSVCHGWNGPKTRVCLHSHVPLDPQGASRDASSVEVIDLRNVDFQPPF